MSVSSFYVIMDRINLASKVVSGTSMLDIGMVATSLLIALLILRIISVVMLKYKKAGSNEYFFSSFVKSSTAVIAPLLLIFFALSIYVLSLYEGNILEKGFAWILLMIVVIILIILQFLVKRYGASG